MVPTSERGGGLVEYYSLVDSADVATQTSLGGCVSSCELTPATRDVGSCAAPSTCDVGSNSRDYYAPLLSMRLEALAPSGVSATAVDITVGAYLILMDEVLSLDLPIRFLLPSGTRCRVHHLDADGDFWIVVPTAHYLCDGKGLCISLDHACDFQLLLRNEVADF